MDDEQLYVYGFQVVGYADAGANCHTYTNAYTYIHSYPHTDTHPNS